MPQTDLLIDKKPRYINEETVLWRKRTYKLFFFSLFLLAYAIGATFYITNLIFVCRETARARGSNVPAIMHDLQLIRESWNNQVALVNNSAKSEQQLLECNEKLDTCLQERVPKCEDGWRYTNLTNSCYKVFNVRDNILQSDARRMCQSFTADLVSIESHLENQFVYKLALEVPHIQRIWLGLVYDPIKKKHIWQDGSPVMRTLWGFMNPEDNDKRNVSVMCVRCENPPANQLWFTDPDSFADDMHGWNGYVCKKKVYC